MSALALCPACASGDHDRHVACPVRPPEGGVGGVHCPCPGGCEPQPNPLLDALTRAIEKAREAHPAWSDLMTAPERTPELVGPCGRADRLVVPPTAPATVLWWLITAPGYHPMWSQYVLSVVTLEDRPGVPPATMEFPGATHELFVLAVDPGQPPMSRSAQYFQERADAGGGFRYLTPVNIAHQFAATDEEMHELAYLACAGVVDGVLNPETGDAPSQIRETWLTACVRTLAHLRGEEHAP